MISINCFHHLLEDLDQNWIDVQSFADAIHDAGSPLQNCWGIHRWDPYALW